MTLYSRVLVVLLVADVRQNKAVMYIQVVGYSGIYLDFFFRLLTCGICSYLDT